MTLNINALSITMLCHYDESCVLFIVLLNAIMLCVVMLNVIILNVVILSVFMLSVVAPSFYSVFTLWINPR